MNQYYPKIKSSLARICGIFRLPPSQTSGFIAAMLFGSMLKDKTYYFKSRSQDLSNGLAAVNKEHKGTLIYEKNVGKILTENNRVADVQTEDGATYPAKIVVSYANAPDTFGKFLSDNKKAQKHRETLAQYKPSKSSFII